MGPCRPRAHAGSSVAGRRVDDDVDVSVRTEAGRLLLRVAAAVAAAIALAALWAVAHGGWFPHAIELGCYVVAGLVLLLAGAGGSPSRRDATSANWIGQAARRDTFRVNAENAATTSLAPAFLFVTVGVVTLLGWSVS